jgi:hypothetical protein
MHSERNAMPRPRKAENALDIRRLALISESRRHPPEPHDPPVWRDLLSSISLSMRPAPCGRAAARPAFGCRSAATGLPERASAPRPEGLEV